MVCTILHAPTTPEALPAELGDRVHASGPANASVTSWFSVTINALIVLYWPPF